MADSSNFTNEKESEEADKKASADLLYSVDDNPPWYQCILLGFQHYLTMFGSTVAVPLIITPHMCMAEDDPHRGYIISTFMIVSGMVTLLQSTLGVRLPIVQGSTFTMLAPTISLLSQSACPNLETMTPEERSELWQSRMRQVQGAIILASLVEILLAVTGVVGMILRFITPLTVAPTIAMIGIALYGAAEERASQNWFISMMTLVLVALFSQYFRDVTVPWPRKNQTALRLPIFKLFPIMLTMGIMWLLCLTLTYSGVLSDDSSIRTDQNIQALRSASWFRVPYPLQWGSPTFSAGAFLGMLAAVFASIIESVGDYYACARISGAPMPPTHAVNRGIFVEGLGCLIAALFGTGNGTTSFSENIGAIGISKVASRRVIQYAGVIMVIISVLGKFGALFLLLPSPVIGGLFIVMFGMITAVGFSSLQNVDLNSSRNQFVLGVSLLCALVIPKFAAENGQSINTGLEVLDNILVVLLKTNMFIACIVACFLDNTIPGTPEERGIIKEPVPLQNEESASLYDIPLITARLKRWKWSRFVPILPAYRGVSLNRCRRRRKSTTDDGTEMA